MILAVGGAYDEGGSCCRKMRNSPIRTSKLEATGQSLSPKPAPDRADQEYRQDQSKHRCGTGLWRHDHDEVGGPRSSYPVRWYAGMEGGSALARVLFGDVNPSGKLPFSIPRDESHLPYFSSTDSEITYDLYHGYTLLEKNGHEAAYPFGFGLSYTTFEYGEPQVRRVGDRVEVSVELRNTGVMAGEEVVQVYVGMKASVVDRPKKLLKGFEKVYLGPGGSKVVSIPVDISGVSDH